LVKDDALTDEGATWANWPEKSTTLKGYHEALAKVMDGPTKKIFEELHKIGGATTRDSLAAAAGYRTRNRAGSETRYTGSAAWGWSS
jgi:hypothetical protein